MEQGTTLMAFRFCKPRTIGLTTLVAACSAVSPVHAQADRYGPDNTATMLILYFAVAVVAVVLYLIPTFAAFSRKHPNRWLIAVINVAFGGTVIGWFGALVWALSVAHLSSSGSNGGESGLNIFANDPVTVRLARDSQPVAATAHAPMVEPTFTPSAGSTPVTKPVAAGAETIGQLERLAALRAAGSLSDEEFAVMKANVLRAQ